MQAHLAIVSRANADLVKGSLAMGEAVLEAASRGQLHQLLPFEGVLTLCLCLLTPPIGLQCVCSLAAPAVRSSDCSDFNPDCFSCRVGAAVGAV